MGFVITFIAAYVHIFDKGLISISYNNSLVLLSINLKELFIYFSFLYLQL